MAGAGKKTFVAGEVLTAAQVNDFLMDQAVMRFSGSAARAASITAPTEGMVTYLDDTNTLQFYNGSAWTNVDLTRLITGSAQVLIGAGSGSVVALGGAAEGQVLTAASAQPGGIAWATPSGAGDAAYVSVAASGVTALPTLIGAGFYRVGTSSSATLTDQQFRFVDADGQFYGVTLNGGTGFITIPTQVASLNVTTGSFPFNVLIEEIAGVSTTLPGPVSVTSVTWQTTNTASFAATTSPTAASVGVFDLTTGRFVNLGAAPTRTNASFVTGSVATLGTEYKVAVVQSNPSGLWGTSQPFTAPRYPFQTFTGNGTYTKPAWSASVDVLVVSGGGGGGSYGPTVPSARGGGGGGGASLFTNVATPSPVAVTVGGAGALGANGGNSSFGPRSTTGGGRGHGASGAAGPGGSGGGGNALAPTAGGTGIAGQGNNGGAGGPSPVGNFGGGGGGAGSVGSSTNVPGQQVANGGSSSSTFGVTYSAGGQGAGGNSQGAGSTVIGGGGGAAGDPAIGLGSAGRDGIVIVRAL